MEYDSLKELISNLKKPIIKKESIEECIDSKVSGKLFWSSWGMYSIINGIKTKKYSFLKLFIRYKKEKWGAFIFEKEKDFGYIDCPKYFLEKTKNSPFIDRKWRKAVYLFHKQSNKELWEKIYKMFHKTKKQDVNDRDKIRIYLRNTYLKSYGYTYFKKIPYIDLESLSPLSGRYEKKLYKIVKKSAIRFEIIKPIQNLRGIDPRKSKINIFDLRHL